MTSPTPENLRTLFEFVFKGFDAIGYKEHLDYELVQSTNPEFNSAIVRVNIFHSHRQTIQVQQHTHTHTHTHSLALARARARARTHAYTHATYASHSLPLHALASHPTHTPVLRPAYVLCACQYIHPADSAKLGQAELVVIDEAAAIPLAHVRKLLGPYLVFLASTVNGCAPFAVHALCWC